MRRTAVVVFISGMSLVLSLSAMAAGGGSGGGSGGGAGGGGAETTNPDPDFRAGMAAVHKNDWQQVVISMTAYTARDPNNADAWNELGHAHRLLGNMDASLNEYAKALKINPKHRDAHEYLGEAYLQMGDLARAEQELKTLDSLCFLPCEQYTDLKGEIAKYRSKQAKAGT
ncbi:tetratricopeptide repeat protein [Variovorax sp. dw_308]|uniref:tetratricopeptide repeat protein n=1 Tax=Variovorax sp. dw_308 TaxID=2721546 RepID=UPI001C48E843|nr:tetratricopeptide repeat protein [Variovorax sp. dw_308]